MNREKEKNLTQLELSEILETSEKIISNWENNKTFLNSKYYLKLKKY